MKNNIKKAEQVEEQKRSNYFEKKYQYPHFLNPAEDRVSEAKINQMRTEGEKPFLDFIRKRKNREWELNRYIRQEELNRSVQIREQDEIQINTLNKEIEESLKDWQRAEEQTDKLKGKQERLVENLREIEAGDKRFVSLMVSKIFDGKITSGHNPPVPGQSQNSSGNNPQEIFSQTSNLLPPKKPSTPGSYGDLSDHARKCSDYAHQKIICSYQPSERANKCSEEAYNKSEQTRHKTGHERTDAHTAAARAHRYTAEVLENISAGEAAARAHLEAAQAHEAAVQ